MTDTTYHPPLSSLANRYSINDEGCGVKQIMGMRVTRALKCARVGGGVKPKRERKKKGGISCDDDDNDVYIYKTGGSFRRYLN